MDSDGSIYAGQWIAATATSSPVRVRSRAASPEREAQPSAEVLAGRLMQFRVSGTNLTLKQPVVFSGTAVGLTNAARFISVVGPAQAGREGEYRRFNFGAAPGGKAGANPAVISGRLTVGGQQVDLRAVPARP